MRMGEDHVHVVLGEEHADAPLAHNFGGQLHQREALGRRHAGGRLVHQQELWVVGERDRKLEPLEIAIGELGARPLRLRRHADARQQRVRRRALLIAGDREQVERPSRPAQPRELHILGAPSSSRRSR